MKRSLISAAAILLMVGTAAAQTYEVGGLMLRNDAMTTSDLFSLSQNQYIFSTARSMGMGGAFTSLGADQVSMLMNPAGMGMYRHGEVTITPLVSLTRADNGGAAPYQSNAKNRFTVGNVGVVFNVLERPRGLMSLNLGFSYNRTADYNYNYSLQYAGNSRTASIADALSVQLEQGGLTVNKDGAISLGPSSNFDMDPYFWNGVAAYKTYLVDRNGNGVWYPAEIGDNAVIDGGASVQSIGSAGEYDISMGGNLNNKLYIGFTLGIQSIYQRKSYYYGEGYSYGGGNGYNSGEPAVDSNGTPLPKNVMQSMGMTQTTILNGSGVNFKLGVTYRPIEALRIGVAFHTPTFYSFERKYQTAMSTLSLGPTNPGNDDRPHDYTSETYSPVLADNGPDTWEFASPSRLMFGASYTFGSFAVISADYERDWYNGIRLKNGPYVPYGQNERDFKLDFKNYFKGSNTFRAGVEIRPLPQLALRAGFGYNGSMLRNKETILSSPAVYQTTYYTAGIGFAFGSASIDLAYCYMRDKTTPYLLYYGNRYDAAGSNEIYQSERYTTLFSRHNIALTLGFRF